LLASGALNYLWSTTSTLDSIEVFAAGNYSVTGTDVNGCTASASQNVTVNNTAVIVISPASATICEGLSQTFTATGGINYLWSTSETTNNISTSIDGTYSVTATNANGCSGTASAVLTVNSNPIAAITPGGATTFCN